MPTRIPGDAMADGGGRSGKVVGSSAQYYEMTSQPRKKDDDTKEATTRIPTTLKTTTTTPYAASFDIAYMILISTIWIVLTLSLTWVLLRDADLQDPFLEAVYVAFVLALVGIYGSTFPIKYELELGPFKPPAVTVVMLSGCCCYRRYDDFVDVYFEGDKGKQDQKADAAAAAGVEPSKTEKLTASFEPYPLFREDWQGENTKNKSRRIGWVGKRSKSVVLVRQPRERDVVVRPQEAELFVADAKQALQLWNSLKRQQNTMVMTMPPEANVSLDTDYYNAEKV